MTRPLSLAALCVLLPFGLAEDAIETLPVVAAACDPVAQDVYYEKVPSSDEVFRPLSATRNMDAPPFASAAPVSHNFLDTRDTGPYPLGLTPGEWSSATGAGTSTCEGGVGTVDANFENGGPNGIYSMWHGFMASPPTEPFIGTQQFRQHRRVADIARCDLDGPDLQCF
ncbi:hypothetical protein, partial [Aestuariicoccus sp. MJ-SS9]|uniref:hypothetical protein n=1 Tax=Aestuariicoccus sp. MJ-SS9 TaxID=3079855 RepID=UPI00290EF519